MSKYLTRLGTQAGRSIALVVVLLIGLVVCGCGGGSSQPVSGPSGVRGVAVILGPDGMTRIGVLPNATINVQKILPSTPTGSIVYGPVIASTQTDAQGNFSILLPAGAYLCTGSATQPANYQMGDVNVDVLANQFLQVTFAFYQVQ